MEKLRLAQALYEMMEDMDFADYEETKEQDIENLAKEIKILQDNECTSLLQLLENVVEQNEDESLEGINHCEIEGETSFEQLMEMYDNWSGITRVNDDDFTPVVEDISWKIMDKRKDLCNKKVAAFGFYDGVMTVRVK